MSDDETKIEPAVTGEKWERIIHANDRRAAAYAVVREVVNGLHAGHINLPAAIACSVALLNDMLPDDEARKITREKIAALRLVLSQWDGCGPNAADQNDYLGDRPEFEQLSSFLDALESYLPPES